MTDAVALPWTLGVTVQRSGTAGAQGQPPGGGTVTALATEPTTAGRVIPSNRVGVHRVGSQVRPRLAEWQARVA